jgi:hypothetical protein
MAVTPCRPSTPSSGQLSNSSSGSRSSVKGSSACQTPTSRFSIRPGTRRGRRLRSATPWPVGIAINGHVMCTAAGPGPCPAPTAAGPTETAQAGDTRFQRTPDTPAGERPAASCQAWMPPRWAGVWSPWAKSSSQSLPGRGGGPSGAAGAKRAGVRGRSGSLGASASRRPASASSLVSAALCRWAVELPASQVVGCADAGPLRRPQGRKAIVKPGPRLERAGHASSSPGCRGWRCC